MKIQTLKRSSGSVERECVGDLRRQTRNLDPRYHPMQRAREYTRAVTAAKMDRIFAKPLVGDLGHGHRDSVTTTAVCRRSLLPLVSGGADGTVQLWDLASRTSMAHIPAHTRAVTGVVFGITGQDFFSCSDDGLVHRWPIHPEQQQQQEQQQPSSNSANSSTKKRSILSSSPSSSFQPLATWRTSGSFKSMDHHWTEPQFATASDAAVQIWSPEHTAAMQTHTNLWGSDDTITTVRFNPAEPGLLACCSADRGIGLFDTRTGAALKKTVLRMRSNDLQWNPMEPLNFVVANEDYNSYSFDMRKLDQPTRIYKGHTSAVMSLSWSPTGKEFVTGSYDRTIRIFPRDHGTSREIYHTKRMQRVLTVNYSLDAKFVVSGSDDTNLRLWKANASEQVGRQLTTREESAQRYRAALIRRYQYLPEVRKIHRARKVPKLIQKQTELAHVHKESQDRKQANRVKYSKNNEHTFVSERAKTVVKQID